MCLRSAGSSLAWSVLLVDLCGCRALLARWQWFELSASSRHFRRMAGETFESAGVGKGPQYKSIYPKPKGQCTFPKGSCTCVQYYNSVVLYYDPECKIPEYRLRNVSILSPSLCMVQLQSTVDTAVQCIYSSSTRNSTRSTGTVHIRYA